MKTPENKMNNPDRRTKGLGSGCCWNTVLKSNGMRKVAPQIGKVRMGYLGSGRKTKLKSSGEGVRLRSGRKTKLKSSGEGVQHENQKTLLRSSVIQGRITVVSSRLTKKVSFPMGHLGVHVPEIAYAYEESDVLTNIDGYVITDGTRIQITLRSDLSILEKQQGIAALLKPVKKGGPGVYLWNKTDVITAE